MEPSEGKSGECTGSSFFFPFKNFESHFQASNKSLTRKVRNHISTSKSRPAKTDGEVKESVGYRYPKKSITNIFR